MAMARQRKRAVEIGFDARRFVEQTRISERERKRRRGPHGAHGMGTRWPDADFKDFKKAGFHVAATRLRCYADARSGESRPEAYVLHRRPRRDGVEGSYFWFKR